MNDSSNIFDGIHTYCLTAEYDEAGNAYYVAHNAYGAVEDGHFESVGDFVDQVNAVYPSEPISVIEIIGVENSRGQEN